MPKGVPRTLNTLCPACLEEIGAKGHTIRIHETLVRFCKACGTQITQAAVRNRERVEIAQRGARKSG